MKNDPKEIGFCKWVFIVSKLLNIAVNDFDAKKPAHIYLAFNIDQINSVKQDLLLSHFLTSSYLPELELPV